MNEIAVKVPSVFKLLIKEVGYWIHLLSHNNKYDLEFFLIS